MSRIEKNQPVMEEMEEMKGEIMGAVKSRRRPGWKTWTAVLVLLVIAALSILFLWTLAATGLANVPVLTRWAYEAPAPTRVVGEGVPFEAVVQQQVPSSSLSIPETTLTTELRDSLSTSGQSFADAERAQVAVLAGEGIELFLPVRDNAQDTAMVVRLRLTVEDGAPNVDAEEVYVGSWKMWSWLREGLVNPALDGALDSVAREIEGRVSVTSVRAEEGTLLIGITVP